MRNPPFSPGRRRFSAGAAAAGLAALGATLAGPVFARSAQPGNGTAPARPGRIRTAVIGCGSVSHQYLPTLVDHPHVELVSVCDIRPERAREVAAKFGVSRHYADLDAQLAGAPFDFIVNLTDMQAHERLNRQALAAGRHVWSEKPIANSLAAGQSLLRMARRSGLRLWGAPITVESPQYALMARTLASGALGRVAAAHADYGHEGPNWAEFFYQPGGGSLPDLAVYNLTTLTGLLGPARHVTAMLGIVTPRRTIEGVGEIEVAEEDNAMVLMDHGNGVISHVQSGFNYFNPHGHDGKGEDRHTIRITGTQGFMGLVGYDWAPQGVDIATLGQPTPRREATEAQGYAWARGAALAAHSLATGWELLTTPEHALHVIEVIAAARESARTGRRVAVASTFRRPFG